MANECPPTLNTLYMIKHDASNWEVVATFASLIHTHYHLHACDILNINFFFSSLLPWKTIILNVITIVHLESNNVKNIAF
jgi:hypothetical protein